MIAYIEGALVQPGPDAVVALADGGLGLDVLLSARGAGQLPAVGERVRLWTHLAVREDSWTLYGFPRSEERTMFRLLISVSGIGPKVALAVLSGAAPADLALLLRTGDERGLARLPGIGKKSAARLVVELGQRLPTGLGDGDAGVPLAAAGGPPQLVEAVAVLGAMGLSAGQAEILLLRAWRADPDLSADLQSWVRNALAALPGDRAR